MEVSPSILAGLVGGLVVYWLLRARGKPAERVNGRWILTYGRGFKGFVALLLPLPLVMVYAFSQAPPDDVFAAAVQPEPRVVDPRIDAAKFTDGVFRKFSDILLTDHVARYMNCLAARFAYLLDDLLERVIVA